MFRLDIADDDDDDARGRQEVCLDQYARETEVGNIEYKLKLIKPSASRFEQLVTQLKWRLAEGGGEAIYEIGVEDGGALRGLADDEMMASLKTLQRMCDKLEANMMVRHRRRVAPSMRTVAEVVVRMLADQHKHEVRVAFIGGGQSGKSTLLAALATGTLDNGQGSARTLVMRHMHEVESGATSSISQQVIGFRDDDGALLNAADATFGTSSAADIVDGADRIVTLLDLCGQARYLKTTLYGLTAHTPDVALLTVRADDVRHSAAARLHASLAAALRLPLMVALTCADASSNATLAQVISDVRTLLTANGFPTPTVCTSIVELAALDDSTRDDTQRGDENAAAGDGAVPCCCSGGTDPQRSPPPALGGATPIVVVSARTGAGLPLVADCLRRLRQPLDWAALRRRPALLSIHGFHPPSASGDGLVLQDDDPEAAWLGSPGTTPNELLPSSGGPVVASGTLLSGTLLASATHVRSTGPAVLGRRATDATLADVARGPEDAAAAAAAMPPVGAKYVIGPDANGRWAPATVLSIRHKECSVARAEAGQSASVSLQVHDEKTKLRRGMVLREVEMADAGTLVVWELEATVSAIQLPNAVPVGTEVVFHCGAVKQAARLLSVDGGETKFAPRDGHELSRLRFRFVHCAEFVRHGAPCAFRDASAGAENLSLGAGWVSRLF